MDLIAEFFAGQHPFIAVHGQPLPVPSAILPGSFNPAHVAHFELARVAGEILGRPVAFELSIDHVEKPHLSEDEVRRRLTQFAGRATALVTRAPRFVDKAALFPGATFVIGADTLQRLVALRYYEGDEKLLHAALDAVAERSCRVLVAGRVDAAGRFLTLAEIAVPERFRAMFVEIPESRFRLDVSSTVLRTPP